jgi:hypothetical protein
VDWNPLAIPFVRHHNLRVPKKKSALRAFNIIVLKLSFVALIDSLSKQNRWLYLEDVPESQTIPNHQTTC